MEEKVPRPEISGRLEAVLVMAAKMVSSKALARGLDLPKPQVEELRALAHDLEAPNLACASRTPADTIAGNQA